MKFKDPAIVVHQLQKWGGAEYQLKVLASIFNKCTIYTAWYDDEFREQYFENFVLRSSILQKFPYKEKLDRELIPLHPLAYSTLDLSKHDLVIVLSDGFEKTVRIPEGIPSILIALTPPRFLWMETRSINSLSSFSYSVYDKFLKGSLQSLWRKWDLNSVKQYKYLISISDEVRKRVAKIYDRSSEIIYPPVEINKMKFNRNTQSREDWYLYFGRVESYKGVELAIRAVAEGHFRLKIAGSGSDLERMRSLVDELGVRHLVGFLGFVSEKQKRELLYKCKALIFPVKDEDFGIIPIEANASGAPVIAYAGGGVLETIKEGVSGVFFREYSPRALIDTIKDFEKMSFDPNLCRSQAVQFSRDRFENKLKAYLRGIS